MSNPRHEKFSQLVASGVRPKEAYTSVGYKPTGAKQAASRLLTNVDVRERVSELQETAARSSAESLVLNRERVLNRLSELSYAAQRNGHFSAAAKCEELIGREVGMFDRVQHFIHINDFDPEKLTADQLEKLMDAWLLKAYGGDQAAVAEAKRQLMGEPAPTVIETTAEPVS